MRIALCGAGSTGKTTLVCRLLEDPEIKALGFVRCNVDARKLIDDFGKPFDSYSQKEYQEFQRKYVEIKSKIETNKDNFITDRSFVDSAAYWLTRDAAGESNNIVEPFLSYCREKSNAYDLHVFCPTGIINVEQDGYRTNDLLQYQLVSDNIKKCLISWKLEYIELSFKNLDERVRTVKEIILKK